MEQQPGIDKKAIAAILLCAVIWAVWMNTNYRRTQQLAQQKAAAAKLAAATTTTGGTIAVSGTGGVIAATTAEPGATPLAATADVPTTRVTLENEVLTIEVSSLGARPVTADLKNPKYHQTKTEGEHILAELVSPTIEDSELAPLAVWFGDEDTSRVPLDARFETISSDATSATFEHRARDGFTVRRAYKSGGQYTLELVETFTNNGDAPVTGRPGVVWAAGDKKNKKKASDPFRAAAAVSERFQTELPAKEGDPYVYLGPVGYIAVHDRYFAAIVAPEKPVFDGKETVYFERDGKGVGSKALGEKVTLQPGQSLEVKHLVYVGPKDYEVLREQPHNFGWVMDWGQGQGFHWAFIGQITKGLWYALGWLHGIVGNWGIAIILLTVVMRALLWPLAARQMRMANEFAMKSQKLKPQLDRLREKYAADPMEMNKQTMSLYKQYGISPFSPLAGCLPLLAQLPIWWALYAVLNTSIDLRGAPFGLWIQDLSAPESLFAIGTFDFRLMPILLGAVTLVQMKLTPQAGTDPVQQKMMMWMMPIMFTFFMWSLPAGLVVYIFTSTLIGIAQQWLLKRAMNKPSEPPSTGLVEAKT